MLRRFLAAVVVIGTLAGATPVFADDNLSHGEVTKIDKDAGKITIKHGPLDNLGMPAMTMVFHVADPHMLNEIVAGDRIDFLAEKVGGFLTVTQLHKAP